MITFLSWKTLYRRISTKDTLTLATSVFPWGCRESRKESEKMEPEGARVEKRKRFLKKPHGDVCCVGNRYPKGLSRSGAPNFLLFPDPFFLSNTPANISTQTTLGAHNTARRGVIYGLDSSLSFTVDSMNRLCSLSTDRLNHAIVLQCSGWG